MADLPRLIHVVSVGAEGLLDQVIALTTGLARFRNEPYVVGPLPRRAREDLSRNGVRWVNLQLPAGDTRRGRTQAAGALARFLGATVPTIVHAHGLAACAAASVAVRRLAATVPLVCSPHADGALRVAGRTAHLLRDLTWGRVLRCCGALIVASEAERQLVAGLVTPERVALVPPGVERRGASRVFDVGLKRRRVGLHQDAAVVITDNPLVIGSTLEGFLCAAARVSEQVANVEFAILGDGPDVAAIKAQAHALGLSGNTVFLGDRHDAMDIVAASNVVAVLQDEPAGTMQALEALARDVRVVVNDLPGLRETFAGVSGVPVAAVGDPAAFAAALCDQLEGMSTEEDGIKTGEDVSWGVSEVLASEDEFDLDRPGLTPRDRSYQAATDIDNLLDSHSLEQMATLTLEVYGRLLEGREEG